MWVNLSPQASVVVYQIADCTIEVVFFDRQSAINVSNIYSCFNLEQLIDKTKNFNQNCRIVFYEPATRRRVQAPSVSDYYIDFVDGTYQVKGSESWLSRNDSLIYCRKEEYVDARSGEVQVWAEPSLAVSSKCLESGVLCRTAFEFALRRCDLFPLHAAAIVDPLNKAGVLIVGASGSGKSTLAWQLCGIDWLIINDDSLLISKSTEQISIKGATNVYALRNYFALTQNTINTNKQFESNKRDRKGKYILKTKATFSNQYQTKCQPQVLMFSQITDNSVSRLRKIEPVLALKRLLNNCQWATIETPEIARNYLETLNVLVNTTDAYELLIGRDVFDAPHKISELIRTTYRI